MELPAFSFNFQTKDHVLRVSKSEIPGEKAFNGDFSEIQDNHESSKDENIKF